MCRRGASLHCRSPVSLILEAVKDRCGPSLPLQFSLIPWYPRLYVYLPFPASVFADLNPITRRMYVRHTKISHHNCVKFNHFTKFRMCDTYWICCCDWTLTSIPSIPFGRLLADLEFGATDVAVNDILSWQKKRKWETFSICIKSNWREKKFNWNKGH